MKVNKKVPNKQCLHSVTQAVQTPFKFSPQMQVLLENADVGNWLVGIVVPYNVAVIVDTF